MIGGRARTNQFVSPSMGGKQMYKSSTVCKYWLAGKCNRNPCRFLHTVLEPKQKQCQRACNDKTWNTWRNPNYHRNSSGHVDKSNHDAVMSTLITEKALTSGYDEEPKVVMETLTEGPESCEKFENSQPKICDHWVNGHCVHGDNCKDMHSWFSGSGFSLLAKLEGHKEAVTGITLPTGFDKLLSASKDESVKIWDCHSGKCVHTFEVNCNIGCLTSKAPWMFFGLQNAVRAWNMTTQSELILNCPNGLVNSIAVDDNFLFAGVEDGSIIVWKTDLASNHTELSATLKGHNSSVVSLTTRCHRLYSGSMDGTIRVWDVNTLKCLETIDGHTDSVTTLLFWNGYLMSGSLDNKLKVWAPTENGSLALVHEVDEGHGILTLSGMDSPLDGKAIMFSSCKDHIVRLYELPTFLEIGRIFSNTYISTVEAGFGDLFFTGDEFGRLFVWKLLKNMEE